MEDIDSKNSFHLLRNNKGEWISEEYAVFINKHRQHFYELWAAKYGIKLSKHTIYDGLVWYYKHEIEQIQKAWEEERANSQGGIKLKTLKTNRRSLNNLFQRLNEEGVDNQE